MTLLVFCILAAARGGAQAEDAGIWLSINEYQLVFTGEISEGVRWHAAEDTPQAEAVFFVQLREGIEVPVFTMTLMQDQGDYTVALTDPKGNIIPVSFDLADRPPGMTDEEKWAFAWAQADVFALMEGLTIESAPDAQKKSDEPLRIVTDAYELTYSRRWNNMIRIVPDTGGGIAFHAVTDGGQYLLFTLAYDDPDGHFVIVREGEGGKRAILSFYIAAAPEGLSREEKKAFFEAQSLVNELADSITLR